MRLIRKRSRCHIRKKPRRNAWLLPSHRAKLFSIRPPKRKRPAWESFNERRVRKASSASGGKAADTRHRLRERRGRRLGKLPRTRLRPVRDSTRPIRRPCGRRGLTTPKARFGRHGGRRKTIERQYRNRARSKRGGVRGERLRPHAAGPGFHYACGSERSRLRSGNASSPTPISTDGTEGLLTGKGALRRNMREKKPAETTGNQKTGGRTS